MCNKLLVIFYLSSQGGSLSTNSSGWSIYINPRSSFNESLVGSQSGCPPCSEIYPFYNKSLFYRGKAPNYYTTSWFSEFLYLNRGSHLLMPNSLLQTVLLFRYASVPGFTFYLYGYTTNSTNNVYYYQCEYFAPFNVTLSPSSTASFYPTPTTTQTSAPPQSTNVNPVFIKTCKYSIL